MGQWKNQAWKSNKLQPYQITKHNLGKYARPDSSPLCQPSSSLVNLSLHENVADCWRAGLELPTDAGR
jgi:hypothetical protein